MNRRLPFVACFLGTFFDAGCALGPNHVRPTVPTPTAWKEAAPTSPAPLSEAWWEIFADPELNAIETRVVAANHDLQRAAARVTEARAVARLSDAELYPTLAAGMGHSRERQSANRAGTNGAQLQASDHRVGFDLGYEFDFWGRVLRSREAAQADVAAVECDFYFVRLALTADAARHYHLIRSLDAEKRVIEATLALRQDTLRLQESRQAAGLINEADVTRARAELATVETEFHAVTRQRARTEHALAILCGQSPAAFVMAPRTVAATLPEIPAGLPSQILQIRPDLAVAEHQLHAAAARIGVAKADFFPRFSLTSSAGFASAELGSWLESGSRAWSVGPSMYLPVFDGGRNRANLAAAEARFEQSAAGYRAAVLSAFRDVEDTLSDLAGFAAESAAAQRALQAARDTAALATTRYERGLIGYLDVVDAQRLALQAELLVTKLHGQRAAATVLLAKALGGGWQLAEIPLKHSQVSLRR